MRKVLFAASCLLVPGVALADVDVMLGGHVTLNWSDRDASPIFNTLDTAGDPLISGGLGATDAVVGSSRALSGALNTTASVDVAGLTWLGQMDMALDATGGAIAFQRGMLGIQSDLGTLFYREGGARSNLYSYADSVAAGGSGISTKLFSTEFSGDFVGDEVGYSLNFGDLNAEVAYDLDHRGFSGQLHYNVGFAGYDFTVGVEGVTSPIQDPVLELLADDYYGLTAMGGVDFGDIELGVSIGQERVSNWMLASVDNETDVKRQFASLGVSYTAIDAIKLSIDMDRAVTSAEWGCTSLEAECLSGSTIPTSPAYFDAGIGGIFPTSAEVSTALSVGAEFQATKNVTIGGYFKQYNNVTTLALDNTTAIGMGRGFKTSDGQEFGLTATITF
ncbi:hypothetical protein N9O95_01825 [Alphaproteobacteria bacterium]|jgi:hypothetical protein|nr:hypothetical protein [Alphaproteobacteria bacterium]